jgi:hypothetical protein
MAISRNNPLLKNIRGRIGKDLVLKVYSYGTVISSYPDMSRVKPSKKQLAAKHRFGDAVRYAQAVMADPGKKDAWQARLPEGKSVYYAAIAEFMQSRSSAVTKGGKLWRKKGTESEYRRKKGRVK